MATCTTTIIKLQPNFIKLMLANSIVFSVSDYLHSPIFTNILIQCAGIPSATLTIAVTCILVVVSVLMFIVGLVCGRYLCFRRNSANKNAESSTSPANEQVEDLELKENVAYVTLRPK